MIIAQNKKKLPEKKILLNKSLKYLDEAAKQEQNLLDDAINNSKYILSCLMDDLNTKKSFNNYYPFNFIYNNDYISPQEVPDKPVLISRTNTTMNFKLPPFKPKINEIEIL